MTVIPLIENTQNKENKEHVDENIIGSSEEPLIRDNSVSNTSTPVKGKKQLRQMSTLEKLKAKHLELSQKSKEEEKLPDIKPRKK